MEDRVATGSVAGGLLVGVFDGHGGSLVAEHAAAHAARLVESALGRGLRDEALWREVFAGLDPDIQGCGSTATLLLERDRHLSIAWVGDSRALLVTVQGCDVLTPDHRIDRADERQRVLAAGASLAPPYVVDPTLGQGLMMTRALGDRELRRIGVVAKPEVVTLAPGATAQGFVVATDGLWDVVTNEEAASICRDAEPQAAAERLVELVIRRDGADNVTVVVRTF
jgi:protein phosphatase 1L